MVIVTKLVEPLEFDLQSIYSFFKKQRRTLAPDASEY